MSKSLDETLFPVIHKVLGFMRGMIVPVHGLAVFKIENYDGSLRANFTKALEHFLDNKNISVLELSDKFDRQLQRKIGLQLKFVLASNDFNPMTIEFGKLNYISYGKICFMFNFTIFDSTGFMATVRKLEDTMQISFRLPSLAASYQRKRDIQIFFKGNPDSSPSDLTAKYGTRDCSLNFT